MRISKIVNSLALALPVITIGLGFINETFFYFAYYAFALTAFIQFGIALFIILDNPKNVYIQLYFLGLLLTILVVFFSRFINLAWILPCILCVYLSIVIYASPPQKSSFMRAEWNDLVFINYEIDPKFLEKYVPKGTELDLWNGKCYLSLIGFMFENVRVLGFKIPFHVNFEEVNLRFYVKRNDKGIWKRGVVFIKEIVPKHAITFVANTLYNEHYQTLPMQHARTVSEKERHFSYRWKKGNTWNTIAATTHSDASPILENSEAEFITEHYYGYTISPRKKTVEYEVTHPRWHQYLVKNYSCTVDFETVYGNEFAFLQDIKPASCFVAKGSKITIESKQIV